MKPGMRMEKFFSAKALVETELARGPVLVADLLAEGEARGISQTTLGRAKRDLGVRLFRPTFGGPVQWALPILLIAMNLSASACPVSIARLRR